MDPSSAARDLRAGVADLSALAAEALSPVWGLVETADEARDALLEVVPAVAAAHSEAAAVLAADWYDATRAEVGVSGVFAATPVPGASRVGAESLVRWAVEPLYRPESDWHRARILIEGGMQARIADAARYTVAESATRDPRASGWQRVGDGSSCAFCLMLIARGSVYSEATARFASHDHCGCMAMPAWKGNRLWRVEPYTPSRRIVTDADRARVQRYLDDH